MALVHDRMFLLPSLVVFAVVINLLAAAQTSVPPSQAKPECPETCGDLIIPYPFGIGAECSLRPEFNITCDESTTPPSARFTNSTYTFPIAISNFSLDVGELQVMQAIARDCYDDRSKNTTSLLLPPPYTISAKNSFFTLGCNVIAVYTEVVDEGIENFRTGIGYALCMDEAGKKAPELPESCSGIGCMQTSIPGGLQNISIKMGLIDAYDATDPWASNYTCSYAFIVEEGNFTFSPKTSFQQLNSIIQEFPVAVNWAIGDESCQLAKKSTTGYWCKENSSCVDRSSVNEESKGLPGYICKCLPGYGGNAYLGCQDIDECQVDPKRCVNGTCVNNPGNYSCECNKGFTNDGPQKCVPKPKKSSNSALKISLGICISFFVLLVVIFWIYSYDKRRKFEEMKKKYFDENGGIILRQALAASGTTTQMFTVEELQKATKNFNDSHKIGEGGYGTVYKGTLADNSVVAIKRSNMIGKGQKDQFVNEVVVLSALSHKNVVRLVGCCAETETPLLVYEFVGNGNLYEHIHKKNGKGPLIFKLRMKIAKDVASALSYLHNDTPTQIVHRDVKTTNILFDKKFTAKVSDFGASRQVLENQDQLPTAVQGTPGYLDPEYIQSNTFTDKSDVYSFGVVLVELITSQVAMSTSQKPEEERSLANLFISKMENDQLNEILDDEINKAENMEIIKKVANLCQKCLSAKGVERPTMKAVAVELEEILLEILPKQPPGGNHDSSTKETIKGEGDSSNITQTEYHVSMQNQSQMVKPLDENDGR